LILVGQLDSPFVRRVAVTMQHYGMPYERRVLSVFGDFDAVREANPLGKVPALILDDGTALFDSTFIIDWLDEQAGPDRALTPREGIARRDVQRLVAVALGIGEKSVERNGETVRRPPDKRVPANVERIDAQISAALDWLEARCGAGFLYDGRLSQADVTLTAALGHLANRHPNLLPEGRWSGVRGLAARCEALPPFQAAPFASDE
jgi:glutathione S-transferase